MCTDSACTALHLPGELKAVGAKHLDGTIKIRATRILERVGILQLFKKNIAEIEMERK